MKRLHFLPLLACMAVLLTAAAKVEYFNLPEQPPPAEYGNLLMDRTSTSNGKKPVTFSHWIHRMKYTCRVCHLELEFNFRANTTDVTEAACREGKFCGACHNGKISFGHTKENCDKCHNGDINYGHEKFKELSNLPRALFGNRINWDAAMKQGLIKPKNTLFGNYRPMPFDKKLIMTVESGVPPAVFLHSEHAKWLDCANCHPEIFNIQQRKTQRFTKDRIVKGEFCGVCHLRTAFPLDDCKRCHRWE